MTEYILPTEEAVAQNIVTGLISRAIFTLDQRTASDNRIDYKPLYYGLYNGITTIIENMVAGLDLINRAREASPLPDKLISELKISIKEEIDFKNQKIFATYASLIQNNEAIETVSYLANL